MLADKEVYGLLVIDTSDASIGFLRGSRIDVVESHNSTVPRKHNKGGQSSIRFERLRNIAIHDFYKRIGDRANAVFIGEPDFFNRFKGLIVGGITPSKENFVNGDYLNHEIKRRIVGIRDVGYTTERGLYELVEASQEILAETALVRETAIARKFFHHLAKDTGLAVYGIDTIEAELEIGRLECIIASTTFNDTRLKQIIQCASQFGTTIEIISDGFDEGRMIATAFGGIVGIRRYQMIF